MNGVLGMWKRAKHIGRCPERRLEVGLEFRCMRPKGHSGFHGWEFFGVRT